MAGSRAHRSGRDADAEGDPGRDVVRERGDGLGRAGQRGDGDGQRGGRHDDDELVAAVAGHHVLAVAAGAQGGAQAGGDLAQHRVARGVRLDVVDGLEAVEVDQRDGARLAGRAGDGLGQPQVQRAPVGQPGERVLQRLGGDGGELGELVPVLPDDAVALGVAAQGGEPGLAQRPELVLQRGGVAAGGAALGIGAGVIAVDDPFELGDLAVQGEVEHRLGGGCPAGTAVEVVAEHDELGEGVVGAGAGAQAARGGDAQHDAVVVEVRLVVQGDEHVEMARAGMVQRDRGADDRALVDGRGWVTDRVGMQRRGPQRGCGAGGLRGADEPGGRGGGALGPLEPQRPRQLQPHPVQLVDQPLHRGAGLVGDGDRAPGDLVGELVRAQLQQHDDQPVEGAGQASAPVGGSVADQARRGSVGHLAERGEGDGGVDDGVVAEAEPHRAQGPEHRGLAEPHRVAIVVSEPAELVELRIDVRHGDGTVVLVVGHEHDADGDAQELRQQGGTGPGSGEQRVQTAPGLEPVGAPGALVPDQHPGRPRADLLVGEVRRVLRAGAGGSAEHERARRHGYTRTGGGARERAHCR